MLRKLALLAALCGCLAFATQAQGPGKSKQYYDYGNDDYADLETNRSGFGVKGGLNFANIFGLQDINTGNRTGFHVGVLAKKPLLSWLAFQPELLYSRRATFYNLPNATENVSLALDYLDAPMLFYFYPFDNMTLHIGPSANLLLGIQHDGEKAPVTGFNRFELSASTGVEFKVYFMRVGARYNLGLRNLLDNSEAADNKIFSTESGWNEENFRFACVQLYLAVHINNRNR